MISKNKILLFLFVFKLSFGNVTKLPKEKYDDVDEAYIELKCKELKDDFFMVRYDFEKDTVYIGLKTFLYFLEIHTVDVDLETGIVSGYQGGKKIEIKLDKNDGYIIGDDIYITKDTLLKKFDFSSAVWNSEELKLNLEPNFELPYEQREKTELMRLRLENENKEKNYKVIEDKKRYISPGVLKFNYYQENIEKKDYMFGIEYGTQFLNGDLYLSQNIKPLNELTNYSLTYNKIYKDNSLIFGNFYFKAPNFLNINSSVEGVSFGDENTYSKKNENTTIIEGEAQGADVVELYQNDILIDYQKPTSRNFKFILKDNNYNGDYTLKIYYKNGQIENRKVYTLNDLELLTKGKNQYNIQYGWNKEQKKQQKMVEFRKGITDNLTLGAAAYDLYDEQEINYQILRNDMVYRYSFGNNPLIASLNNYFDITNSCINHEIKLEQKIKDIELKSEYKKYSNSVSEGKKQKEYLSFGGEKEFKNQRVSTGFFNEKFFEDKSTTGYYLSYENRVLRSWNFIVDTQFSLKNAAKKIQITPTISYNGFENLNLIMQMNYLEDENVKETDYKVKLMGRRKKSKILRGEYNYNITASYNDKDKFQFGIEFTYYFDNYIYIEAPITSDKNEVKVGLSIEKAVDLSDIKRNIKDREVENSWVYGKVFTDSNNNGIYDNDEKGIEGVKIDIDGKKAETDSEGNYLIEGLLSQEDYKVIVDRKSIDPMLIQVDTKSRIRPKASVGMRYNIPMQTVSMLAGYIYPDGDISDSDFIRIMSMMNVTLEKDGEKIKETEPEFDGMYYFEDVLPGKYEIHFSYLGDEKIKLSENKLEAEIILKNADEGEYFEGYDIKIQKLNKKVSDEEKETDEDSLEDILTNY